MPSYCHVFLTFFQTQTGFVKFQHSHTSHFPSSHQATASLIINNFTIYYYTILYLYLLYVLTDAARREARGPMAVHNPGNYKQIKGIKKNC